MGKRENILSSIDGGANVTNSGGYLIAERFPDSVCVKSTSCLIDAAQAAATKGSQRFWGSFDEGYGMFHKFKKRLLGFRFNIRIYHDKHLSTKNY